ncbi:hypothetical protein [Virgibacillus pantothenticus]|nr:hypothetical protein [Virgibacillus pantothenticus]
MISGGQSEETVKGKTVNVDIFGNKTYYAVLEEEAQRKVTSQAMSREIA